MRGGFCDNSQLGRFIIDLPTDKSINQTSFWTARVGFGDSPTSSPPSNETVGSSGFWDNPEGNPTPPDANSEYTSPWKRGEIETRALVRRQDALNPSPGGILRYSQPIQYLVRKTGYYCVGTFATSDRDHRTPLMIDAAIVPLRVRPASGSSPTPRQTSDIHPDYSGTVLFKNKFSGKLSASDYPKVNVRAFL